MIGLQLNWLLLSHASSILFHGNNLSSKDEDYSSCTTLKFGVQDLILLASLMYIHLFAKYPT